MNAWKLTLLAVAISIVALGVAVYAQQTVYVNGSYVVLLPNTTMSPLLEWLLNQKNAPVPQSGILIPVSDLPNVTVVTGYTTWYVYMNLNYTYISARWATSNMPSTVTATYTPSNATLKFTVPSGVTATNAKITVNFTLGPWNYIIPNSVYGYEENYGTYPVLWLPLTIWDKASGTYNFSITAFMTFPNGTTKQVPVMTPNENLPDIEIFLNPWNNSYDYYVFTYKNAVSLNKSLGILVTRTTSYVDVGVPIGALLYSEVPVNITLVVTAFYNATTSGTIGISLYMPVTSIEAGTYTYYYTSESNYAYIADVYAGFDGFVVTSPLYLPNFTCYFNIVQQLFECYEGNHFVPVAFRGGLLTGNFSGSLPLFIEYPYYFYRFGGAYTYVLYPNGTSEWIYDNIRRYQSWFQTAPAYVSTAVGYRLVEAVGVYWSYPSVPNYQWKAMYTELSYMWYPNGPNGLFTNTTIGTLFYANYTKSDLANRLTFSVTAPAFSMSLARVGAGGYTFWANAVNIVGLNNVTLGNNLTSGYSLVIVLNPSTLDIINTYKVPAGSNVTLQLSNGNYLIINMIPPQYNATEANILNLTQNPQYYPFAWSFDPAAQVYYISVSQVTQNATINLNATAYPLLLNVTVYTPSGAVNSSTVNMTGPTQLVVLQYSNVVIKVVSIPRGYNLNYTQWTVVLTNVTGTVNYTYYLLPIIPINVTFLSLCPSYTLSIFNTFNGTTSTLQLGYNNTVVLYYNMTDTYSVTSYPSECRAVGALSGEVTPLLNGQLVVIPLVNPNAMVVPWYGYSIPQQYLSKMLSVPLGSQLLMLPPPPRTVDYYQAIPIVPLPWSNAYGFVNADLGEFFNGYITTQRNGTIYINNSATNEIYLFPDIYSGARYAFLIYNTSSFPLPLILSVPEVPYYMPAQLSITYEKTIPITIPIGVGHLDIDVNLVMNGGFVSSCNIPSGATLIYSSSGEYPLYVTTVRNINGHIVPYPIYLGTLSYHYSMYQLGNKIYECFTNFPYLVIAEYNGTNDQYSIYSVKEGTVQIVDTVTATVTLSHVVGSFTPVQFTINKLFPVPPIGLAITPNYVHVFANVAVSSTTVSISGTITVYLYRGGPWVTLTIPISITASAANMSTPLSITTEIANYTSVTIGGGPVSMVFPATSVAINGTPPISENDNGALDFSCGKVYFVAIPFGVYGMDDAFYPITSVTCVIYDCNATISSISNLYVDVNYLGISSKRTVANVGFTLNPYNVTINAFVGGPWSWLWQPAPPPGTEGIGLIAGGFPYPFEFARNLTQTGTPPWYNMYNVSILPLYVSNWTVVDNVPNVYGTVVVPAAFGNSPNSAITATYTTTIPLSSFNNLAAVQVGETVQGLFNGTFTATYKYGPYTYIVQLTATPTSITSTTLNESVIATRELLVNGEVVLMNTTRLTLTNIPIPYVSFQPFTYDLPQASIYLVTTHCIEPDHLCYVGLPIDVEPLMADSEILGGNYGTLQVTYQLTEYPITIALNKTLVYSWYQGPNAYNYTVTQYLFPAVLITPGIYALTNATTQPINTFYTVGYTGIYPKGQGTTQNTTDYALSLLVAQDNISGTVATLDWTWYLYYTRYGRFPVTYLNGLAVPLIGLYTPPHDYPLPLMSLPEVSYPFLIPITLLALRSLPIVKTLHSIPDYVSLFNAIPSWPFIHVLYTEPWASNSLYALPLGYYKMNTTLIEGSNIYGQPFDVLASHLFYLHYPPPVGQPPVNTTIPVNITVTQLNGTDLVCMRSNPLRQLKPVFWYPMNISEVVPSFDVGVYYVLGEPTSGFYVPLLQAVNVTNLCFVPVVNGTYLIIAYTPPQSLLKSVYLKLPLSRITISTWIPYLRIESIINASGTVYTPVLIALTNKSFAMDYRDVVNPMSPDVLWLNIVQPQYLNVTANLTAIKLLFPNVTITPFSVNITSNGTLTASGTGVIIVNASSTSPTPITYSGGASTSIMQVQYMATYFAGVTAKVVLNTVGTDLTPLVARFGLPLFSVNGTASTSPIAVLALPKATNTIRICIPPAIGPIVVVNSGCFNAAITANETLPLVIYVRLPVNLNITAINNNGKLVVEVTGTDFFGNPVVYYPINVTVYLSNGTVTYTAVIRNGVVEVSTGLPYQSNTLITAQGNGTGAYLPASAASYVPVTSVSTLPPWLAYIGSIWWLLLLVILLVVLIVVMIILERKRAKKRRVRAYTPYWV